MSFNPVIAFTVSGSTPQRVAYLRKTLDSWSKVRGIGHQRLVFCCEPGHPETVEACATAARWALLVDITVNPVRYGVLGNPWAAIDRGFKFAAGSKADFVILAEEDLIVSPDVLEYFQWCQRYRDDQQVLGVTTYQHHERPGGLAGVGMADWSADGEWHFWVWGTWRDRWENLLRDDWDFTYEENGGGPLQRGFDWKIRNTLVRGKGLTMIAPSLCRSQHIGEFGGVHCMPGQFEALRSSCFAGMDVPPQDYREVSPVVQGA